MQFLSENPHLGKVFKKMIKQGIQEEISSQHSGEFNMEENALVNKTPSKGKSKGHKVQREVIKSPSDTTIYAPALRGLRKTLDKDRPGELMERISNFVEEIRLETTGVSPSNFATCFADKDNNVSNNVRPGTSHGGTVTATPPPQPDPATDQQENFEAARKAIINAEKHKASAEPPPKGMLEVFDVIRRGEDDMLDDDQFFHLACHVDGVLKGRIERGEFIDLEKLLPKKNPTKEEGRLEWVTKDGMTFLAPAQEKDNKITNFKQWDQAFRVYAAIYCAANPSRAGEIWQYNHTISSAAMTYQWDNVSYYDTVFRQMMAERPGCNWSKLYTHMWQLALRDPINKHGNFAGNHGNNTHGGSSHAEQGGAGKRKKSWKDNCCWRFNRLGKCDCTTCTFDNRCTVCGMWNNHGASTCCKKTGPAGGAGQGSSGSSAAANKN